MGQARSRSMAAGPAWSRIGGMQRVAPGATEQEALNPPTPPRQPLIWGSGHAGRPALHGARDPPPTQQRKRRGPGRPHVAQAALLLIISIHRAPIMSKNN